MDEQSQYPLINILIRTSNRPREFARCLDSIVKQDYPNIRIIVGYDNPTALRYIPKGLETVFVSADKKLPYFYDEYLPQMMGLIDEGFMVTCDDDDIICHNVLSQLPLEYPGLLVQLQRGTNIVPKGLNFTQGGVGFPCLILHHSLKHLAKIHGNGRGDFHWISDIKNKVNLKFVPIIVTYSFGRGLGKCNG